MGGGTPSKAEPAFWIGGTIPWVSAKDMKSSHIDGAMDTITEDAVCKSAARKVPAGSVLCVMRSGILAHTFPVAVNNIEVTINQDLRALVVRDGVDPDYLAHFLRYSSESILHLCSKHGTTVSSIEASRLDRFEVPLPSLDIQRHIVARIDELFAELDDGEVALARARSELETYRKALLKAAVTGELTADWRAANPPIETGANLLTRILADRRARWGADPQSQGRRYKVPVEPEVADLSDLPEGWVWTNVGTAGDVLLGRQRAPVHHSGDHMRPYLRVANVMEGRLDLRDVKKMNFTPREFETFCLKYGDVLLNEGQTPDLLGRPAIYRDEISDCCFQKTLLRFRPTPAVTPEFALVVFRRYMHGKRFLRESRITTNIGHLTQVRFLPIEFPLPPILEQRAIAEHVREAEDAWEEVTLKAGIAVSLRQSILAAAFRGDLVQ